MGLFGIGNDEEEKEDSGSESDEDSATMYECADCGEEFKEDELDGDNLCKKCVEAKENETNDCDDCGEEFKNKELNDDNLCAVCAAKKKNKEETSGYKVVMEIKNDGETSYDNNKINRISLADAINVYQMISKALLDGKSYIELPDIKTINEDEEEDIYPINTIFIGNIDRIYYIKESEDE